MAKEGMQGISKLKLWIGIVLLIVLCAGLVGLNVYQFFNKSYRQVTSDSVREEIIPVAKMTTYEYNFTQIMATDDSGNPLNIKNPITGKLFVATVDGTANIGVDAQKIECNPTISNEGALKSVAITLPHSEILSMDVDPTTLKTYADEGTFNKASKKDLNDMYVQARKDQEEKVETSGMLDKSDERVKQLLETQIHSLYGSNVKVSIGFTEEK